MKIAIASDDKLNISQRAARARYWIVYEFDSENFRLLGEMENPATTQNPAGLQAVSFLSSKSVDFVIAGNFGNRMMQELIAKGIKTITKTGSIDQVLQELKDIF